MNQSIVQYQAVAISEEFSKQSLEGIQAMVGGKFSVNRSGLEVMEGENPTQDDFLNAIGNLAESANAVTQLDKSLNFALGDLVNIAHRRFGEEGAQNMIACAVSTFGRAKHTVNEAYKVARNIEPQDRIPELSFTHHQILLGASKTLTPEQYKEVKAFVLDGEKVTLNVAGEEVVQQRPKSSPALREKIKEITKPKDLSSTIKDPTRKQDETEKQPLEVPAPDSDDGKEPINVELVTLSHAEALAETLERIQLIPHDERVIQALCKAALAIYRKSHPKQ